MLDLLLSTKSLWINVGGGSTTVTKEYGQKTPHFSISAELGPLEKENRTLESTLLVLKWKTIMDGYTFIMQKLMPFAKGFIVSS